MASKTHMKRALARAIKAVGGARALAETLKITRQAVERYETCPPQHVLTVERVSEVSRHDLRPDLYPRES